MVTILPTSAALNGGVPLAQGATVDRTVLLFTLMVALLTALITGIIPAFRVSSANPGDVMKLEGRSLTGGHGRQRLVAILVASEVAITLMLLIATGLMVKSANRLWHIDPGFDTQDLLTMTISLPNNKFQRRVFTPGDPFDRSDGRSSRSSPRKRSVRRVVTDPSYFEKLPPDLEVTGLGIVFADALLNYFRASLQGCGFGEALAEQFAHSFGLVHIAHQCFPTSLAQCSKLLGVHFFLLSIFAEMPWLPR